MGSTNYRPGAVAVLGTVAVSFLICVLTVGGAPAGPRRAASDLSAAPLPLGPFAWTERSGATVRQDDLAGRVWIASFIFTRCKVSCPRITATTKGIQGNLEGSGVRLVSVTVDPEHDTPEVLSRYAEGFGADPARWLFLTGPKAELHRWIVENFKLPARDSSADEVASGAEEVAHSSKLALVDRGNRVVGFFNADDPNEVKELVSRARRLDSSLAGFLPTWNATLNGLCAVALVLGWSQIRARRVQAHAACMVAALALSAIFLASYLYYHFGVVHGSVAYQGEGRILRVAYFTILLSHTVLAAVMVPLVVMTVRFAWTRRFEAHARMARLTFPIWLYVSITGVVVYWMLYRMPATSPGLLGA
jgi:protein SCO1/2/putative membrane protein